MLFELIAAVVAGVAVAGLAMGMRWLSRGLLPKWIVPAAAGLGMLSYAIWSEYSWFTRLTETQPEGVVVAWHNEESSFWRPWSYYKPVVTRFTAVDMRSVQRHPNLPDQVMVDVILAARWQRAARVKVVFDCAGGRRADLVGANVSVADDGSIVGATWTALPADDPVLAVACKQS
ncbi:MULTISPECIES: hypothetical protein [Alphaproteobacteria]|uniref:Uncharacterized protein n=2 Tax=Alphaproteobacteria TaxID=28211 RepID=A0A512HL19_9HYPH|nr:MULTISPECIES: hypothetical protein [Alphaproteobacteria]GEO86147.1 hypothetical protein RNA01_30790 [Ciceribacter naphthalenivorans]GLR22714.1 hypothetical protein GCM10007920_25020 [Ciceribacter naphthalenivorans]GLT05570.1 hypothetical protein GCM10007926_25020 [Sphingomonas psychrolutea]